ncbi:polymorphic toxin type 15 domain-containing protein [Pseudomonas alliivorans]|nr:polymorphic toxin type 15 domain-containing protein [Pseudomonas alliivorans]
MPIWNIVPTWFEIENRITHSVGYQGGGTYRIHNNKPVPTLALHLRRINHLRSAFTRAEWTAANRLRRRFSDIDISSIVNDLIDVATQVAMIVAGSTLTGGAIGAGVGTLFGGAGAVPFGAAGAMMGLQVSTWILSALGLMSIAEFLVDNLPRIGEYYLSGISIVWNGTRGDHGLNPFGGDDFQTVDRAADQIARGHEEMVLLLLGAIVAYLTRGRGNASVLASEMQASSKGARLGQWMLKHEDALKRRTDLPQSEPRRSAVGRDEQPAPPPPHQADQPPSRKRSGMPEHKVPCFNVSPKHLDRIPEFDRQLAGQQKGLNDLTVDEYLKGREAFKNGNATRDPKVAEDARKVLSLEMEAKITTMLRLDGAGIEEAEREAKKIVSKKMTALAALHNPDMVAGGKDVINDLGDRRVNSSIGPQWSSRIGGLDSAASQIPDALRNTTNINTRLERCR